MWVPRPLWHSLPCEAKACSWMYLAWVDSIRTSEWGSTNRRVKPLLSSWPPLQISCLLSQTWTSPFTPSCDRVHRSEDGRSLHSPPLSLPLSIPHSLCPSALPPPLLSIFFLFFSISLWSLSCFWKCCFCFPSLVSTSSLCHTRAFQSCRYLL